MFSLFDEQSFVALTTENFASDRLVMSKKCSDNIKYRTENTEKVVLVFDESLSDIFLVENMSSLSLGVVSLFPCLTSSATPAINIEQA